jgi:hypothetical protein
MCKPLLIFFALTGLVFAGDDPVMTNNFINGRMWVESPDGERTMYVEAIREMTTLATDIKPFPETMKIGEVIAAVTSFYGDATNLTVPVLSAMFYVKRKSEGATPEELKDLEARLRRTSFDYKKGK